MLLSLILIVVGYKLLKWLLEKLVIGNYGNRYVFITGCDTGFGCLLAKQLDSLGFHVFAGCLTEKGEDGLRKASSERLMTLRLDVSKEESIAKALAFVKSKLPRDTGLWGVVNNAGIAGTVGPSEMQNRADYQHCLEVNLYGLIDVTRAMLPLLRKSRGRVVNLTSIMGRAACVSAPYNVSKFGAEAYSDTLRREVYRQGISVHIVEPGFFRTNILNSPAIKESLQHCFGQSSPELREFYGETFIDETMKLVAKIWERSSPDLHLVVDALTHALTARFPRYRYVVGTDAKLFFLPVSLMPEWLGDWLLVLEAPVPKALKS